MAQWELADLPLAQDAIGGDIEHGHLPDPALAGNEYGVAVWLEGNGIGLRRGQGTADPVGQHSDYEYSPVAVTGDIGQRPIRADRNVSELTSRPGSFPLRIAFPCQLRKSVRSLPRW